MTARNDSQLHDLEHRYPGWQMWRGRATGDLWALPPPGHPQRSLIGAKDADELEAKVAEITLWDSGG
jgi:hypothetical protein